jgi:hypothetical protein
MKVTFSTLDSSIWASLTSSTCRPHRFIKLVVDGRNDNLQVVVDEVLDIGRRLDRQAKLGKEVRNRSEPADVVGVDDGRAEIPVVRDYRQRVALLSDPRMASKMNASGN